MKRIKTRQLQQGDFPGKDRRSPKIYHRAYLVLSELSKHIQQVVETELTNNHLRFLDVGCGEKPYYPFFKEKADLYIGVDVTPTPYVDAMSTAEQLPFIDSSFDVIICTQLLEHANEPQKVIEEMYRVLKKDGIVILSTHGIWFKHAAQDYWRWTDLGLKRIFSPFFREVEVRNCGGSILCFFQFLNLYIMLLPFGKSPLYFINNVLGRWLDRIYHNDYMVINYLVYAKK